MAFTPIPIPPIKLSSLKRVDFYTGFKRVKLILQVLLVVVNITYFYDQYKDYIQYDSFLTEHKKIVEARSHYPLIRAEFPETATDKEIQFALKDHYGTNFWACLSKGIFGALALWFGVEFLFQLILWVIRGFFPPVKNS